MRFRIELKIISIKVSPDITLLGGKDISFVVAHIKYYRFGTIGLCGFSRNNVKNMLAKEIILSNSILFKNGSGSIRIRGMNYIDEPDRTFCMALREFEVVRRYGD